MYKRIALLFAFLGQLPLLAQSETIEMADVFRRDGKIYVVVAVMLVIFAGIVIYLFRLDRKMTKLEEEVNQQEKHSS